MPSGPARRNAPESARSVQENPWLPRKKKKERKKEISYSEGKLKGIGSSEGMQPYNGEVGIYGVRDSTRQELPAEVRA